MHLIFILLLAHFIPNQTVGMEILDIDFSIIVEPQIPQEINNGEDFKIGAVIELHNDVNYEEIKDLIDAKISGVDASDASLSIMQFEETGNQALILFDNVKFMDNASNIEMDISVHSITKNSTLNLDEITANNVPIFLEIEEEIFLDTSYKEETGIILEELEQFSLENIEFLPEEITQKIIIENIIPLEKTYQQNEPFDITFDVVIFEPVDSLKIVVKGAEHILPRTKNLFRFKEVLGNDVDTYAVKFSALEKIQTGTHPIEIQVSYSVNNEETTFSQITYVQIEHTGEQSEQQAPPKPTHPPKAPKSTPIEETPVQIKEAVIIEELEIIPLDTKIEHDTVIEIDPTVEEISDTIKNILPQPLEIEGSLHDNKINRRSFFRRNLKSFISENLNIVQTKEVQMKEVYSEAFVPQTHELNFETEPKKSSKFNIPLYTLMMLPIFIKFAKNKENN